MSLLARYVEFPDRGNVRVNTEEVSTDGLGPQEVLVRSEASVVSSGIELAQLWGMDAGADYPFRPGYTCVGRILKKGSALHDFVEGDRVFFAGRHSSVQRFTHGAGHQWGRLYHAPENLDPSISVFAGLAQVSMIAPLLTNLDIGDTVAVFGLGPIGNLAAQLYQLKGARVIALDPISERCEVARSCGIQTTLQLPEEQQVDAVVELTDGRGVDVAVDAAGSAGVVGSCILSSALFGQVVLLGTPRKSWEGDVAPWLLRIHEFGLTLRGAHVWRLPADEVREVRRTAAWSLSTMFDLIDREMLNVNPLRSHLSSVENAAEVYTGLQTDPAHYFGVVFDWRGKEKDIK